MKTFFLLFISLSFNCFELVAQNPYSYVIDKSVGLPSNAVYDVFQDKKGFMWFATGEGLSKYDGTKFHTFTTKNQTSKSGSNIIEDNFGRVWYINFDGYLYYVQNNQLHAFKQKNSIGYYEFGIIGNKLFTIQKNSIEVYDLKKLKRIKKIKFDNTYFKATHLSKKYFYVFTNKLLKIDSNLNTTITSLPNELVITKSIVIESNLDDLYIVSKANGQLYKYSNQTFEKEAVLKGSIIQNLSFVDNKLWLATTSGLFEYKNKNFINYYKEINISTIFKDQENKFWITTLTNGLLYIPNFSSILWKCNYKPVTLNSDNNTIAIGYENDILSEFNPNNYEEKIIFKGNSNHEIYKVFKDETNYFITSNNFKILNKNVKDVNIAVKDVVKIDDKYYAFAASGLCGLFSLDYKKTSEWDNLYTKYFTETPSNLNESKILVGVRGKSVAYNPNSKTIFFATNVGLYAQTLNTQKEIQYKNKPIFCQKIYYHNNCIYLLSNEYELLKIDQNNTITTEKISKNLITDDIKNIKLIDNILYIFTNNAIFQFNLSTKKATKIQNITPNISVSDIATLSNQTILATSSGLIIKPNTNLNDESLPKFILNKVLINYKQKTATNFEFNENNLSFDFSVLAYLPNTKFPISYKINNGNWVTLEDNQRSLNLSSLAAGDYSIQFKIENIEKTDKNIINYNFSIQKPFWESTIFILFSILLLAILFYFLYQSKLKKIQQKNQIELNRITLENNLNESKLTAIKSQMNPHFFYNALNTIQSYILSNDKKEAIIYLNKFSSLTRTILELTEKNYLSINEEIKTITLYLDLEKARFFNDFNYTISIDKEIDTESIKIPTMLLQPFIENAIKHGLLHLKGEKTINIVFKKTNHSLEISIDDNGIGRKRSEELNLNNRKDHISFATNAIEKRLEILNLNKTNKITVSYIDKYKFDEPIGTTVIINIPTTWK
ncbi:sensor histidine kinase [Flavobacterium helocola]|uniref:Histidine kinase n=1 Tax=Flavobacterium helocola TaxID=3139139 RepID=A0ABU9I6L9_9FLAO